MNLFISVRHSTFSNEISLFINDFSSLITTYLVSVYRRLDDNFFARLSYNLDLKKRSLFFASIK